MHITGQGRGLIEFGNQGACQVRARGGRRANDDGIGARIVLAMLLVVLGGIMIGIFR